MAKRACADALREGANLIVDSVLSKPEGAVRLGAQLAAAGYQVHVIDVECAYEVSLVRIANRWKVNYQQALNDEDPFGGRWVPSEYVRGVFGGPDGRSWPEASAQKLAQTCGAVMHYEVYRVDGLAPIPERVVALGCPRQGGPLVDITAADAVRRAEPGRTPSPGHGPPSKERGSGR